MPYQIPCPKCAKLGFIRVEHVISGRHTSRAYYCGACEHNWTVADSVAAPSAAPAPRKPATRRFGPRRARPAQ